MAMNEPGKKKLAAELSKGKAKKPNPFAKKPKGEAEMESMDPMMDQEDLEEDPAEIGPPPLPPAPYDEGMEEDTLPMGRDMGGPQEIGPGGNDTASLLSRVLGLAEALAAQLPAKM